MERQRRRMIVAGGATVMLLIGAALLVAVSSGEERVVPEQQDVWVELQSYVDAGRLAEPVLTAVRDRGVAEGLVTLDDRTVSEDAARRRMERGLQENDARIVAENGALYAEMKERVLHAAGDGIAVLHDYALLPVLFLRVERAEALAGLLRQPEVVAVQENRADPPAGVTGG